MLIMSDKNFMTKGCKKIPTIKHSKYCSEEYMTNEFTFSPRYVCSCDIFKNDIHIKGKYGPIDILMQCLTFRGLQRVLISTKFQFAFG